MSKPELVCMGDTGALLGLVTLEKPIRRLRRDSVKAGGHSRVEFRGEVQVGDINLEVISSTWMGLEL